MHTLAKHSGNLRSVDSPNVSWSYGLCHPSPLVLSCVESLLDPSLPSAFWQLVWALLLHSGHVRIALARPNCARLDQSGPNVWWSLHCVFFSNWSNLLHLYFSTITPSLHLPPSAITWTLPSQYSSSISRVPQCCSHDFSLVSELEVCKQLGSTTDSI